MTLDRVYIGQTVTIVNVLTTCNCVLRIMTLGLIEGTRVKFISSTKANIEIQVYGRRIALSKHCAKKIIVV